MNKLNYHLQYAITTFCIGIITSILDFIFNTGPTMSATDILIIGFAFTWANDKQSNRPK